MTVKSDDRGWLIGCAIVTVFFAWLLGFVLGTWNGRYAEQVEAMKAGAGRWEVDRGSGGVSFVYRTCR